MFLNSLSIILNSIQFSHSENIVIQTLLYPIGFNYDIRADPILVIGCGDVRQIPCRCSARLTKMDSLKNRIKCK